MDLWVRPRNKGAVLTMETSIIPATKKSAAGPQERQGYVDLFFRLPWGWCITNTHHKAKLSPKGTTRGYFVAFVMLCGANDRNLWAAKAWQLHHDNAPTHSSHLIQGFLAKNNIPLICQAPYSPDMAPCDFWLFGWLVGLLICHWLVGWLVGQSIHWLFC